LYCQRRVAFKLSAIRSKPDCRLGDLVASNQAVLHSQSVLVLNIKKTPAPINVLVIQAKKNVLALLMFLTMMLRSGWGVPFFLS
jgi:hypothetical protein